MFICSLPYTRCPGIVIQSQHLLRMSIHMDARMGEWQLWVLWNQNEMARSAWWIQQQPASTIEFLLMPYRISFTSADCVFQGTQPKSYFACARCVRSHIWEGNFLHPHLRAGVINSCVTESTNKPTDIFTHGSLFARRYIGLVSPVSPAVCICDAKRKVIKLEKQFLVVQLTNMSYYSQYTSHRKLQRLAMLSLALLDVCKAHGQHVFRWTRTFV